MFSLCTALSWQNLIIFQQFLIEKKEHVDMALRVESLGVFTHVKPSMNRFECVYDLIILMCSLHVNIVMSIKIYIYANT